MKAKAIKTNLLLMFIGIFISLLAGCFIVVSYGQSIDEINNKINNAQDKINQNNAKEQNLSKEMEELNNRISETKEEINKLSKDVSEAYEKLLDANEKLEEGKRKLNEQNKNLGARLRNIYKSGGVAFIDVILSSSNPSELFSNLEMVKYIFKNDNNIVATLKKNYESLSAERDEVAKMESSLKKKQSDLTSKEDDLDKDYNLLSKQKSNLSSESEKLKGDISKWQAESEAIKATILANNNTNNNSNNGNTNTDNSEGYTPPPVNPSSGGFIYPVNGILTSSFGTRVHPITGAIDSHWGIDLAVPYGTPIKASKAGRVIISGWATTGYGNYVVIDHGGGFSTVYGHNSSLAVSAGQSVVQGQTIAYAGSTGMSTGNHCHFEIRVNGNVVNPLNYL